MYNVTSFMRLLFFNKPITSSYFIILTTSTMCAHGWLKCTPAFIMILKCLLEHNTHMYIPTYTHTYTYTHIHTPTHTHTHTHIHTHTHTHTHIHLPSLSMKSSGGILCMGMSVNHCLGAQNGFLLSLSYRRHNRWSMLCGTTHPSLPQSSLVCVRTCTLLTDFHSSMWHGSGLIVVGRGLSMWRLTKTFFSDSTTVLS